MKSSIFELEFQFLYGEWVDEKILTHLFHLFRHLRKDDYWTERVLNDEEEIPC